jgi:putative oxidoreductase
MILRRLARPMLAAVFIWGGVDTLRNPGPRVKAATPFLEKTFSKVGDKLPEQVPTDPETLVKLDAAVKVGAGVLFALNKFPRLSALLLAGTLVPTTLAGHPFWEQEEAAQKAGHQVHFLKNVGLIGGLLIASGDTEGKPSVGYRARQTAKQAKKSAKQTRRNARKNAKLGIEGAKAGFEKVRP